MMDQESVILIVDDEKSGRDSLEASLYGQGYNLVFVDNASKALEKAREIMPDLILLDVMMKDIDGFEACELIRKDPVLSEVPVIMITALDDHDSLLRGIQSGADDFVSKFVKRVELQARVRTVTRLNRYRKLLDANKQLKQEMHKLTTLYDISSSLNSYNDMNIIIQSANEKIKECIKAEKLSINFETQDNSKLSKIADWVFHAGKSIRIRDISKDDRFSKDNSEYRYGSGFSCLCVPLLGIRGKDSVLGVIEAIKKKNDEFTEDDQQLLEAIANNIAISYEKNQIYQELQKLEALSRRQNAELRMSTKEKYKFKNMIGNSNVLMNVVKMAEQIAQSDSTVMIYGETGTGKELLAQAIHQSSPRANRSFIAINCSAIPENLLESELFGHEKGSYTGANMRRIGRFEDANGGTLFLDEIGDMPMNIQVRILRVLQDGIIQRLGSNVDIQVDVRILTATHQDLPKLVADGKFRKDLYYRLRVFELVLPSLRERSDDIPLLINHFIKYYNEKLGKDVIEADDSVVNILNSYDYPGNIRELQYIIESAMILCKKNIITINDIPETTINSMKGDGDTLSNFMQEIPTNNEELKVAKSKARQNAEAQVELLFLKKLLSESHGNISEASRKAGMNRSWLAQLVSKHKLDLERF